MKVLMPVLPVVWVVLALPIGAVKVGLGYPPNSLLVFSVHQKHLTYFQ